MKNTSVTQFNLAAQYMVYAVTETYGAYDKRNKGEVGSSEKKLFGTRRRNGGRRSKYTVGNIPAGNGNGMY